MKKQINYKKEFIEFLRERDLITSFCAGLAHPKWLSESFYLKQKGKSLFSYINQTNAPNQLIMTAFLWTDHTKGADFWEGIDKEWRLKCTNYKI